MVSQFSLKNNSIGLIRLGLATAVIFSHSFLLGGFGMDPISRLSNNKFSIGELAVDSFFAISGYLIVASFFSTQSTCKFFWNRFLRIFPGYWVYLFTAAFILPVVLGDPVEFKYFYGNILGPAMAGLKSFFGFLLPIFLGWSTNLGNFLNNIPFVATPANFADEFANNPFPLAVNSSLWSIIEELRLYLLIGFLGVFKLLNKKIITILLAFYWFLYAYFYSQGFALSDVTIFRCSSNFMMGAFFYYSGICFYSYRAILCFIISLFALRLDYFPFVAPYTTAYVIFWLASFLPFNNFGKKNDYSYGAYIFAYPIQQFLSSSGLNKYGFIFYFSLSIIISMFFAAFSWHLVEKQALKLKKLNFNFPI